MSKPLYGQNEHTRARGLQRAVAGIQKRTRGYTTVHTEATPVPQRDTVDFQGAGVSVADDATNGKTIVTVAGGGGGSGSILLPPFQPVPLMAMYSGAFDDSGAGFAWNPFIDTAAVNNAVFTNSRNGLGGSSRTPAINDYFTMPVALGPKGSTWAIFGNWRLSTDGGIFKITIASVPDTAGQLESSPGSLTYINPVVLSGNSYFDDTYQGITSYDGVSNVFSQVLTIGGDDYAPCTTVTGTDTNGNPVIDGGAGNYKWKLEVTGKNGSSSGYRVDLMNMAWVRLDDGGLI